MNNARRKRLAAALALIDQAESILSDALEVVREVQEEEQEALDALPDSFRDGERGERMQEAIDALDEVTFEDALSEARDAIGRASE